MKLLDIIFIGIALSMDAVAVSASNGLIYKPNMKYSILIAAAFGIFQAVMPLIGYLGGTMFATVFSTYAPYIALILLSVIGVKMLLEAFKKDNDSSQTQTTLTIKMLALQAIATSIDALIVGVSFAGSQISIYISIAIIGAITIVLSYVGVIVGKRFGNIFGKKAEIAGGLILIIIGIKIFIEGIINAS